MHDALEQNVRSISFGKRTVNEIKGEDMTKTKKSTIIAVAAAGALVCALTGGIGLISVSAAPETTQFSYSVIDLTLTSGGKTVTNVMTDPYTNTDSAENGQLVGNEWAEDPVSATQAVVYTPRWLHTTSNRSGNFTEYTVQLVDEAYKITEINTSKQGDSYIPTGGYVLSLPSSTQFGAVGDTVTIGGSNAGKVQLPAMAVESKNGNRVAIDVLNGNRSGTMVVYYDYQSGDKTGTNIYGTEMAAVYDAEKNAFVVRKFRAFGEGDASGMEIPDGGFVLSSYGVGYRGIFAKDKRFSLGDELSLVGFDYVRFGSSVTYNYNFINPTLEANPAGYDSQTNAPFPAYRGTNQLNIYRDGWSYNGAQGTGCNVYGYEVAVDKNGVVVERSVNVSKIPTGGYVLSGHGTGRDFLRSNVTMGATVVLNETNKSFTATTTLNSFYTNVEAELNQAVKNAQTKLAQLYDIDKTIVQGFVDEAESALASLVAVKEEIEENDALAEGNAQKWDKAQRTAKIMEFNSWQLRVERIARSIVSASLESKPVAARAVWHRPTETSLAAIDETLRQYTECGVNVIFVESFYGGMSLFKSAIVPYHRDFQNANYGEYPDYLTAFVSKAHEKGIETHAWVEDFYVGINENAGVYSQHPEWVLKNDDGSIRQRNEGGDYIFLDPANPLVQNFLITFYKELLEKVPYISGLNLDYIRYPVSSESEDTGYTEYAMKDFAESIGKPLTKTAYNDMLKEFKRLFSSSAVGMSEALAKANRAKWNEYRQGVITGFVKRIKTEIKDEHEGLLLSTSVFSSVTDSKDKKMQDWQTWFKNGWIDIATPMAYFTDSSDVLLHVGNMIQMAGSNCYYYAGLASSYSGLPAYENANQIEASYLAGANGYVVFCSTQIIGHEDVQEVLKAGANRLPAALPHASVKSILQAYYDCITRRATDLYIPAEGMTEAQLAALQAKLNEIIEMDTSTSAGIENARKAMESLAKKYNTYAKGYSARRLQETLSEAAALLDTKLSRSMIDKGEWDPESTAVRPTPGGSVPDNPPNTGTEDPGNQSGQTGNDTGNKGCKSAVGTTAVAGILLAAGAAFAVVARKNKKGNNGSNSDIK